MMNLTQYAFDTSNRILEISPLSMPIVLWNYYMRHLWYYEQDSWVARIAYTCRVLAVLICLPVVIFTLLDVASYVLARTLGVIDDVKASTSDKETVHDEKTQVIHIEMPSEDSSTSLSESDHGSSVDHRSSQGKSYNSSPPTTDEDGTFMTQFYAGGDDHNNLELSGVGVFSPAASRPPSPNIIRKPLSPEQTEIRHRALPQVVRKDG